MTIESLCDAESWIVAVAAKLMDSGKYDFKLYNVWIIWRCLFQDLCCGLSRDSSIPNEEYNKMRKKCYITAVERIESHPGDVFAMNCAAALAGYQNIS